ncbi:FAD/NAD(P)-binding domain-containing protein [Trichocladium antarcticum]|uniref:FAD/NAD(P)-binding domain-containing protein n=1 Tax=Trichocladium antarcticum TaxID=1450529 RepID=A0AAN6ZF04_9PEZI|nr:FAD/NAD(P)-binding domain-containing protein [Trichocladium antarcticum]
MKEDLLSCSRDLLVSFQPRAAIRARAATPKKPHVGVIGAGLAGLRCAEVLLDGGAQVTVLEARDRIGGRVHQSTLLDQVVDMGPNWVHGTDDNPVWRLARETGCSLCAVPDTMQVFEPDGRGMSADHAAAGLETVRALIEDAFRYSSAECRSIGPARSLEDFFRARLAEGPLSADEQARVLRLAETWGSFIGDPWARQSLRWFWLEECLDGGEALGFDALMGLAENLFVMESHAAIVQRIAAKPLAHADMRLSTVVTSIESTGTDAQDTRVVVRSGGGVFEFDEVVVTVPLGCLKQGRPAFVPQLPQRLQSAVQNASYSSLEKVYITFPTAFWEPNGAMRPETKAAATVPGFAHFLRPEYVARDQKHHTIEIVPLSSPAVFGPHAKPTLLIYTHDPCATQLLSQIRGLRPDSAAHLHALDRFAHPYYSRLPNYRPGHADCTPCAVLATDWHGDDLAGNGSYTNFQVGQIRLDDDVRAMRAGLPERGIWFAGEHVAPFVALGTTTGAYWSGEAAALRVLAANGLVDGGAGPSMGVPAPAA